MSFRDLSEPPFDVLTQASPEVLDTSEWADTSDADRKRNFVQLLNQTLRDMHHRDLKFRGSFAYFKSDGGERRDFSKSNKGRAVVKAVERRLSEGAYAYRHTAAWLHFLRLSGTWFLSIRPDHHYTHDGFGKSRLDAELTKGLKQRERNAAVRRHVEFWASFLSPQPTLLDAGDASRPLIEFGELLTVVADHAFTDPAKERDRTKRPHGQGRLW